MTLLAKWVGWVGWVGWAGWVIGLLWFALVCFGLLGLARLWAFLLFRSTLLFACGKVAEAAGATAPRLKTPRMSRDGWDGSALRRFAGNSWLWSLEKMFFQKPPSQVQCSWPGGC